MHEGADDQNDGEDGAEEHRDLPGAGAERRGELARLGDVVGELEHPKYAQKTQRPDHEQGLRSGDDEAEVGRQDRQQIDDAEEASRVLEWSAHCDEP